MTPKVVEEETGKILAIRLHAEVLDPVSDYAAIEPD